MTKIYFRLPSGHPRFAPSRMSEDSRAHGSDRLYDEGLEAHMDMPPGMRVPLVGESVTVPGSIFDFTVHHVQQYFGPDGGDNDEPFEPFAYVVLR